MPLPPRFAASPNGKGARVLELYQAEWCPYSHRVRERLTELASDFLARQVEAQPQDRHAMRAATGHDSIPLLVTEDGEAVADADPILAYLDEHFEETREAGRHRAQARAHAH